MYHGGVTLDTLDTIATQVYATFDKIKAEGAEKNIEQIRKDLTHQIKRQEALWESLSMSKHFFRWMALYNNMSTKDQRRFCPAGTSMMIYDVKVLASFGLTIDYYAGPSNQQEVNKLVDRWGSPIGVCYWSYSSDTTHNQDRRT